MESLSAKREFQQEGPQGRHALNIANLLCTTDEHEQPFKIPNVPVPPSPQSESASSPGTPIQEYLEPALFQPSTSAPGIYRHTMLPFRPELTRSLSLPPPSSISLPSIVDMDLDHGDSYKFHTKRSSLESPYEYDPAFRGEPFGDADAIRYSQILKAKRKRANAYQLDVLNRVFDQTFFPSTELRAELGKQLGMSPRTVQIWFQNKRQSIRTRQRVASERQQQYMARRYT